LSRKYRPQRPKRNTRTAPKCAVPKPDLAVVRPIALGSLEPGSVVWTRIRYRDGSGDKTRPAVVIARTGRTILVAPATTSVDRALALGAVRIENLASAGLGRATAVQPRLVEVDRIDLVDRVGRLAEDDLELVLDALGPEFLHAA
jgi:mRNA-degrading endonuclease toxin of MazEF toxin-antitoxin module